MDSDRRSDDATAVTVDVEIIPQRRRLRRSQTDFALEAIVEFRAAKAKCIAGLLRWHTDGGEVRRGLMVRLRMLLQPARRGVRNTLRLLAARCCVCVVALQSRASYLLVRPIPQKPPGPPPNRDDGGWSHHGLHACHRLRR